MSVTAPPGPWLSRDMDKHLVVGDRCSARDTAPRYALQGDVLDRVTTNVVRVGWDNGDIREEIDGRLGSVERVPASHDTSLTTEIKD